MPDAAAPKAGPKGFAGLTKNFHGAPIWVWALGGGVVGFGIYRYVKSKKAASSTATTPTSAPAGYDQGYGNGGGGSAGGGSGGSGPLGGTVGIPVGGTSSGSTPPANEVTGSAATTASPSIQNQLLNASIAPTPGPNVYGPAGQSFIIGPGTGPTGMFFGDPTASYGQRLNAAVQAGNASAASAQSAGLLSPGTTQWRQNAGLA